jgi:DNA-binding response OmpR family regulator
MANHVLVVDDEPEFLELITHGLRANGYECSEAENGMEALQSAREQRPDAVMLDVMLPDLDGFTICEMLRRNPDNHGTAVLMMTCLNGQMSRLNGLSAGADAFLTKPVKIHDLVSHVRRAIRRRAELLSPAVGSSGADR